MSSPTPEAQAPLPWRVVLYGAQARRALLSASGRVVAVFRRSFYLQTPAGLACIGPPSLGAAPLNVLAELPADMDWQASGLRVRVAVERAGDLLYVGCFRFFLGDSALWQPSAINLTSPPLLRQRLSTLLAALRRRAQPAYGLGPMIVPLLARSGPLCPQRGDPCLQAVAAAVQDLAEWLGRGQDDCRKLPFPDSIVRLLGMGWGLTPGGDDFIAGVLLALRYSGKHRQADALAAAVMSQAKTRTNLISYHHLLAACQGQASAAIHRMLAALCGGRADLCRELDAVAAIGHSSGWDTLAGMVTVLVQNGKP